MKWGVQMEKHEIFSIPLPAIRRFPAYLRLLKEYQANGETWISATKLADDLQLKPIQVRKDMAYTGVEGKPKVGFLIEELILAIRRHLGWDNTSDAVLLGVGNLGSALVGYKGFENYGLRIVAVLDADPEKVGNRIAGVQVLPLERLEETIRRLKINIAILTVPAEAAQYTANRLANAGIRGIWNFAPKDLRVPDHVIVQRTDLATGLAELSSKIKLKIFDENR